MSTARRGVALPTGVRPGVPSVAAPVLQPIRRSTAAAVTVDGGGPARPDPTCTAPTGGVAACPPVTTAVATVRDTPPHTAIARRPPAAARQEGDER